MDVMKNMIMKSESDNDYEPTKDELIDMLEDVIEHFDIKRREYKDLRKESKPLMSSMHLMIV